MLTYYYRSAKKNGLVKSRQRREGAVGVVTQATDEDVRVIAGMMKLAPQDLTDIFDVQEIPRLEIEDGVVLLFVRAPLPLENQELLETRLYMLIYNQKELFVVTNGKASHLIEMLTEHPQLTTDNPGKLLIEFLLYISRRYSVIINEIARKVDQARTTFKGMANQQIEQLVDYEVILNEYLSVLSPMQQMCTSLVQHKRMGWQEKDTDLLEDLNNNMAQSATVCLVNLKKMSTLRDSFEVVYTNRLNQTVKLLTAVTILLTIPTMLASLFGMNVGLPLSSHPQAFWLVLLSALGLSGLVGWIFKRNKWV